MNSAHLRYRRTRPFLAVFFVVFFDAFFLAAFAGGDFFWVVFTTFFFETVFFEAAFFVTFLVIFLVTFFLAAFFATFLATFLAAFLATFFFAAVFLVTFLAAFFATGFFSTFFFFLSDAPVTFLVGALAGPPSEALDVSARSAGGRICVLDSCITTTFLSRGRISVSTTSQMAPNIPLAASDAGIVRNLCWAR